MILFSKEYLEPYLFSSDNKKSEIRDLINQESTRIETDLQSTSPDILYAVDFLVSLMSIDSCSDSKKEIKLDKEFSNYLYALWKKRFKK